MIIMLTLTLMFIGCHPPKLNSVHFLPLAAVSFAACLAHASSVSSIDTMLLKLSSRQRLLSSPA